MLWDPGVEESLLVSSRRYGASETMKLGDFIRPSKASHRAPLACIQELLHLPPQGASCLCAEFLSVFRESPVERCVKPSELIRHVAKSPGDGSEGGKPLGNRM